MKPARVIGTVTLGVAPDSFRGGRWLMLSPMGKADMLRQNTAPLSKAATLVAYDDLGAGLGDEVLYVEGAEAMAPFPFPIPLDAITVAILDTFEFKPPAQKSE